MAPHGRVTTMGTLGSRSSATDAGANAAKYALIVASMILAMLTVALGVWANLATTDATLWH
jgi:hypothetical protein